MHNKTEAQRGKMTGHFFSWHWKKQPWFLVYVSWYLLHAVYFAGILSSVVMVT
jgi:hypothetical protein